MNNEKVKPSAQTEGNGEAEAATGSVPLPLNYTTSGNASQTLSIGRALRIRDAIITLERRLAEVRAAFEADIAEVLRGGSHD